MRPRVLALPNSFTKLIMLISSTMTWHYEIKEFYDYADDIEGVNIHYLWTPLGGAPDWDNQRETRFMPLLQPPRHPGSEVSLGMTKVRLRQQSAYAERSSSCHRKFLILRARRSTDRYLLHHYFEIFQDGHRHYSPLYTEELYTGTDTPTPQQ